MEIIELACGRTRASVAPEAGGRIVQLSVFDGDRWLPLLHAPRDPALLLSQPLEWGSYVTAPWPGRMDVGRFTWEGRLYNVPVNAGPHSIHGRGVYREWVLEEIATDRCRLSIVFEGWPFPARATQEVRVRDDRIEQRVELRSEGGSRFPAGIGWHPWFRRDIGGSRDARVLVDADRVYETQDMIPTGWLQAAQGDLDLRAYPALGDRRLDACYRHPRALAIRWGSLELRMESFPNVRHAVVYTPVHAVCVEPQTCASDAFNLARQGIDGVGVAIVSPSRPLTAETVWRWSFTRSSP